MTGNEIATLVADATPYVTAAVGAYGVAVRLAIRAALAADAAMLAEVRSILAEAPGSTVIQQVHAGRDAYVSARDMTIHQRPG